MSLYQFRGLYMLHAIVKTTVIIRVASWLFHRVHLPE